MNLTTRSIALGALIVLVAASSTHEWDYGTEHGPQHWGDLEAEFASCGTGHRQSPIDIRDTEKADLPPIEFDYKPSSLRIIDNGHTIMATYDPGSAIRVGGVEYKLKQIHFHRPSEETINGKASDMVAHLVHADAEGHPAVVAVLLEHGKENALVRELWKHIPKEKEKEALVAAAKINAADLPPQDRGYYTFEGSLTTPPCSEGVTWFVLKHQVPISENEINVFAKLYPKNARPAQPLYDRVVKETR